METISFTLFDLFAVLCGALICSIVLWVGIYLLIEYFHKKNDQKEFMQKVAGEKISMRRYVRKASLEDLRFQSRVLQKLLDGGGYYPQSSRLKRAIDVELQRRNKKGRV